MKKIYLLLMTLLMAVSMNAQKMCIWREGSKLFELEIHVNDSITFEMSDTSVVPPAQGFNYEHWREQTNISIYHSQNRYDTISLPWASVVATSIPSEYKHPELDTLPNGAPKWQLAFNFCDSTNIPGVDMFGLWDAAGQIMRIYAYLEQLPNPQARSCFYDVTSSTPAFISADTRGWMPSQITLDSCSWSKSMPGRIPTPTLNHCELLPITGTLDGEVLPGWICYEISFASGIFKVPMQETITFSLIGVEQIDFTGEIILSGVLKSNGGKITIPGNKNKEAAGILSAVGGFVSGASDFVMKGMESSSTLLGGAGIFGAAMSMAGGIIDATEEAKDKHYSLELNFNIADTGQINGSLTSHLPTTISPVQITYERLFEQILKHPQKQVGFKPSRDSLQLGVWSLETPPVFYVGTDVVFSDDQGYYVPVSFLDPGSVKLLINEHTQEGSNPVVSASIAAYDFVFTNPAYTMPAEPYRNFYEINSDFTSLTVNNATTVLYYYPFETAEGIQRYSNSYLMDFVNQDLALSDTTHINEIYLTRGNADYMYSGAATISSGDEIAGYDVVCCPGIHSYSSTLNLDNIYVAVAVELTYANGDVRVFADRFLPQIKGFTRAEAATLYNKINAEWEGECFPVGGEAPLFEALKYKAKHILEPVMYYIGYEKNNSKLTNNQNSIKQ